MSFGGKETVFIKLAQDIINLNKQQEQKIVY